MPKPEATEIRWAAPDDAAALAPLLAELRAYYDDDPVAPPLLEEKARTWLKPEPGRSLFVLAFVADQPAGLASVAVMRPVPGEVGALFMKELFVSERFRGHGIGKALLSFLARHCIAEGFERIDFTTDIENDGAVRFYEREGASVFKGKISLRFDSASLGKLASGEDG